MQGCVYTSDSFEETETDWQRAQGIKKKGKKKIKVASLPVGSQLLCLHIPRFFLFLLLAKSFFRTKVSEHNGQIDGPFRAAEFLHKHTGGANQL